MKKRKPTIVLLLLFSTLNLSAQNEISNKNAFLFGVNYGSNGHKYINFLFYRTEYIRDLNNIFSIGGGIGFYNFTDSVSIFGDYENYSNSLIAYDITPYLNIINSNKHLVRFGVGYSLQHIKFLQWIETYGYNTNVGTVYVKNYQLINTFVSTYFLHLEYGFKINNNFTISATGRYYSEKSYSDRLSAVLSFAGINILYSF